MELVAGKSELVRHNKGKKHQKKVAATVGRGVAIQETPAKKGKRESLEPNNNPSESIEFESILDDHGISHVLVSHGRAGWGMLLGPLTLSPCLLKSVQEVLEM